MTSKIVYLLGFVLGLSASLFLRFFGAGTSQILAFKESSTPDAAVPSKVVFYAPNSHNKPELPQIGAGTKLGREPELNPPFELKLYSIDQWHSFPSSWITKSDAISFAIGLGGADRLNEKFANGLQLSDPQRQSLENFIRLTMRRWVTLCASSAQPNGDKSWLVPSNVARSVFLEEFDRDMRALIGEERTTLFKILAARDLSFYFGNHPIRLTSTDGGSIEINAKNFGVDLTKNIDFSDHNSSSDPWIPLFRTMGVIR